MSISPIFPNSLRETERVIFFYSDDQSLLALSRVSKLAQAVLTNPLFELRFFAQYPHLKEFKDKIFVTLCSNHPNNCWKMVCDVFSRGSFQIRDPWYFFSSYSNEVNMNFPFFAGSISSMCDSLEAQKTKYGSEIKKICGDYYEDPKSPIDQAWKALKAKEQECLPLQNKFDEILKVIELVHSEELPNVFYALRWHADECFPNGEVSDVFLDKTDEEMRPFKREHVSLYASLCKLQQEGEPFGIAIGKLERKYQKLEEERIHLIEELEKIDGIIALLTPFLPGSTEIVELTKNFHLYHEYIETIDKKFRCESQIEKRDYGVGQGDDEHSRYWLEQYLKYDASVVEECNHTLARLKPQISEEKLSCIRFFNNHKEVVQVEFCRAKELEYSLTQLPNLQKCFQAIEDAIEEPTAKLLQQIHHSINSCDLEDQKTIWGGLYHECAGGIEEDRWSEIHFSEFLPNLKNLVDGCIFNYTRVLNRLK